jgi:hypothetical protein
MRWLLVIFASTALAGCATGPQLMWTRMDGKAEDGSFQAAHIECRGEAAQTAANSPAPVIPHVYALAAAKRQRDETLDAVMQACMSKRGYVLAPVPNGN